MTKEASRAAVAEAVRKINQAWTSGKLDALRELVHPEIVLATPGFGERIHGSEAYVAGHRDFVENAEVHDFSERELQVDVAGSSAVATYRYVLDYERGGQRYESTGRDLFVFELADGRWRAVWRTIVDVDERAT